jgi:tetratricopeptide (TPR) repeat protein
MMRRPFRRAQTAAPYRRGARTRHTLAILTVLLAASVAFVGQASAADEQVGESASVDSLLARADRALGDGDAASAEVLFSEALSMESGEHRALCGLAIVGLIEDDPDKAIKYARKAIKKDKKNSRYHFMLANGYGMKAQRGGFRAMFYGGKFKKECELAVEYDPENVQAHLALMSFYAHAPSIMGGGMEKARERAETIASLDAYYGHVAHAMIAKREEDFVAAESSYLAAAAVDSQNADGWSLLGTFYIDVERPADAVPVFERVRELVPDDLVAVYQLARARAEAGDDLAAAEEGFKAYIAAEDRPEEPEVASAHWRLALVYEGQGRYAEAMAELDEAIRLNPEHVMAVESKERLGAKHP